jgi:hypothetical protein
MKEEREDAETQQQPCEEIERLYATSAEAVLDSYFQLGGRVFFSL